MAYKPAAQEFNSQWNKAVAWAESQGISADAYLPVYQLDAQRLQNYGYGMSAAERNRAILAAANPNDVTPAASDHPSPWSVLGNIVRNVGQIATGIIHAPTELFDMAKNTLTFSEKALEGKSPSALKWMQDTVLALVPGVADAATYFAQGGGAEGLEALAENPVSSLLDVLPAGTGARILEGTTLGDALAEKAGLSTLKDTNATKLAFNLLSSIKTSKSGIVSRTGTFADQLSIGDLTQNWLAKIRAGPVAADAAEAYLTAGQVAANLDNHLVQPLAVSLNKLAPDDKALFNKIFDTYRTKGGDLLADVQSSAKLSPELKEAIDQAERLLNWHQGEALAKSDVVAIRMPNGESRIEASVSSPRIVAVRDAMTAARREYLGKLAAADRLTTALNGLDEMGTKLGQQLDGSVQKARSQIPETQGNTTMSLAKGSVARKAMGVAKWRQVNAVLGTGGLVNDFQTMLAKGDAGLDQAEALLPHLLQRMRTWGPKSIDAADNPEFATVAKQLAAFGEYFKTRRKLTTEIDHRLYGEHEEHVAQHKAVAEGKKLTTELQKKAQAAERMNLAHQTRDLIAKAQGRYSQRLESLDRARATVEALFDQNAAGADRLTPEAKAAEESRIRVARAKVRRDHQSAKEQATVDLAGERRTIRDGAAKERAQMALRQRDETDALRRRQKAKRIAAGELVQSLQKYYDLQREFQKEAWDTPSLNYRDVKLDLLAANIHKMEHTQELIGMTEGYLAKHAGFTEDRLAALRTNPRAMAEMVSLFMDDVLRNQVDLPAEAIDQARQAYDAANKSANDELHTLIAQGLKIPYIPTHSSFAEREDIGVRSDIPPTIGRPPTMDHAKSKVWDFTAKRHDFALNIDHAIGQVLQRDASIELVDTYLAPMAMSASKLRDTIARVRPIERVHVGPEGESVTNLIERTAREWGLVRFDPKSLFGFSMPRFAGEAQYLPEDVVRALQSMSKDKETFFSKGTQLFRYSILGLSPRYTAHVLFGGLVMQAIKSPGSLLQIGRAVRAVRDGALPEEVYRVPFEEGMERYTLHQANMAGGRDAARFAVQEWMHEKMGKQWGDATVGERLSALAHINYTFTRYLRDLESAMVYLDGSAKAEKRAIYLDPHTGEAVEMTRERAFHEGMQAVERVFGNLHRMTPFARQMSKYVIPFYGWTQHILKYVMTLPIDSPYRAMVLAQLSEEASANVPAGLPERIQLLLFFGSPDQSGNATAMDIRFLDPFRDIANYGSTAGWLQALNPAFSSLIATIDPSLAQYGTSELYPNVTYNQFYGIETAAPPKGAFLNALEQYVPQVQAVRDLFSAHPEQAVRQIFDDLNVPGQVEHVNVKQLAAKTEDARYEAAKDAATTAFQTGDFSALDGYTSVPYPLNPDYEVTPAELQQIYDSAQSIGGISALPTPRTPAGY